MSDFQYLIERIDSGLGDAIEYMRRNNFVSSSPCVAFGAKLSVDGNQFCFLLGDNLQDGIAGFGQTPAEAMADFDNNFFNFKLGVLK